MAMSSNKTIWGFLFWVKNNPYKSVKDMDWPDLYEMAKQFIAVNVTTQTLTVAPGIDAANEGFGIVDFSTDIDFPKQGTTTRYATDGNGVAASTTLALNKAACEQSLYPDESLGS
jgi:hypothetical protein